MTFEYLIFDLETIYIYIKKSTYSINPYTYLPFHMCDEQNILILETYASIFLFIYRR